MTLRPYCEEFCRIKFLNIFKIFATTLRHLATHARKIRITGDCFETALRPTRDACRQLSQNSRSPVRYGLTRVIVYVVCFRLSYIYLSLVLRRTVLIRCQYIFRTHFNYFILSRNVGTPIWHKNIGKLCWSESVNGRKTGPRQRYPFPDAGKVRIGNSRICL